MRARGTLRGALSAGLVLVVPGTPVTGQEVVANPHVTLSLVPEHRGAAPGQRLAVAVRFQLEPGWHVYWEHPGQSGIATTIIWSASEGVSFGPVTRPVPELLRIAGIVTHVHHGDLALATSASLPAAPARSPLRITAEVRYGVCRDLCLPGKATLRLEIPWTGMRRVPNPGWAEVDRVVRSRQPAVTGGPVVTARLADSVAVLQVSGTGPLPDQLTFFPADRGVASAAVTVAVPAGTSRATLRLPLVGTPAGPLRGVLVAGDPGAAAAGWLQSIPLMPR